MLVPVKEWAADQVLDPAPELAQVQASGLVPVQVQAQVPAQVKVPVRDRAHPEASCL